ncbi:trans-sulfuration enzyme family protein [Streptomyces violaceusniger]|uniref:trans-sulfuration enzyme family protein n=2 Tax=Streptomyces TaxID=1883 RepID=UPI00099848BE|nr:aminotransferase class I/II-fold pyridoxal phosphate-dependent enzyme [Streptomyces hygroscopicus]AQW48368.1 methionine gamma-lyase [Streptomyces hygroscopicus]AQW48396.1 methionine gamma-lyase [Streptomyces hygroscopicus]
MDASTTLETLLLHADTDPAESSIAPPIYQSVHFSAASAEEFEDLNNRANPERYYRRYGNPSQARLEKIMAAAEGAEAGLATASGMGAISATLLALLDSGDHVVAQRSMYGGTLSLLQEVAPRFGIETTLVDQTDPTAFEKATKPNTKLIMLETPSNPLLQLTDVATVARLARERGILTFVDNTVATPVNHRPIDHGVDLVMHSVTKYLSGHSDVLAGIVLGKKEMIDKIWQTHTLVGSVISPFDAWLALRGLRTLPMRVERHNRTALAVAQFLAGQPAVKTVNYPGLTSHPQHELAKRQMHGYGGLLSFELRGGYAAAEQLIATLGIPARSPSLGGVRSVVVQPAAMWANELTDEQLAEAGVPAGLVRLAVGLEHEADLIADLTNGLATLPDTTTE